MLTVKAEKLSKEWNGQLIFEDITMEIFAGEHVALIGANGMGKTTLLQVLMGRTEADNGRIWRGIPVSEWGLLEQQSEVDEQLSTLEFVQSGNSDLYQLKQRMNRVQGLLEQASANRESSGDTSSAEQHVEEYGAAYEQYVGLHGYEWEIEVEKVLSQLLLEKESWSVPFVRLSGGQKTRAQLARLLIQKPKLLLLDEPTNHLDQESLIWLEEWLNQYTGTVVVVSHDRYFLDKVAHVTYELTKQGAKRYKGGYSEFRSQREEEIKTQQALYRKQQQRKQQLLDAIQRYRRWFEKAHNAAGERNPSAKKRANKHITRLKSKEKELHRLESEHVKRPTDRPRVQVRFEESEKGKSLLSMTELSFSYGDRLLFEDFSLVIKRDDRIAVTGPNGAGKSTLLKLIIGDLQPTSGRVASNPQLKIGYFAQELEKLDTNQTILESLLSLPNMTQTDARTILACFLFRNEDVFKRIGELSMGEKCRVAFVRLYFSDANLLVLDEPTNYLDIETRERIEEALENYPGALVLVSHDRYLMQKVANRVVALNGSEVQQFHGTFKEYEERIRVTGIEPADAHRADRIRMLELQAVQLIGQEEPEDTVEREQLVNAIRGIRAEIKQLKQAELQ